MAEVVVTPKNDDRYGHVGEMIDILKEFDPNALIKAEQDGSFSIVDDTIPNPVEEDDAAAAMPYTSNCYVANEDGSMIVQSEEEFEENLTPNVRGTLMDMRCNNEAVVKMAAGVICDSIYDGLVNALGYIMEYGVHAHAHMAAAQQHDMCHIVDNRSSKGGKKRR